MTMTSTLHPFTDVYLDHHYYNDDNNTSTTPLPPPLPLPFSNLTTSTDNSSLFNDTGYFPASPPPSPDVAIKVLARFHLIAVPVIVVLGIVGNVLSFCIFVSKTLRRTSCSLYLAARCVSDTGFLLSVFITWLGDAMGIPVIHTMVVCQVVVFASYVFGFLSVWLVVCITLENYIRICHPFSVCRHCTVQKAQRVLLGLCVLSVALYQFPLWTTHVVTVGEHRFCGNKAEFLEVFQALVYLDMVITLALPSLVIIFFLVAIFVSLVRSLRRQSRLKGSSKRLPNTGNHPQPPSTTTTTTAAANGAPTSPSTEAYADDNDDVDQDGNQDQLSSASPTTTQEQLNQGQVNGKSGTSATTTTITTTTAAATATSKSSSMKTSRKKKPPRPPPLLPSSSAPALTKKTNRRSVRGTAQAKVTRLLFAVSFTFLVLSLPSHIVRLRMLMLMVVKQASSLSPSLEEMLQVVFQILYYLSFAVNLLVYLSCGESFRNVFIETYVNCLLGRRFRRRRSEMSRTSYSMVKTESPKPLERGERETPLLE
ncbi:uncharacterized protein LOC143275517 [Babylonia areolata]|uniref:uncharacterized protein LOC143275517 n=1 Tax=Babylonia areolata TaxID=304850 RepID=UPI003FCF8830